MDLDLETCLPAEEIYKVFEQCSERTITQLRNLGVKEGMSQRELLELCSATDDVAFNELVGLNVFGPLVTFSQICELCSGTDEAGQPNSFAVLTIDTVTEDTESLPYESVAFGSPVLNMYSGGGCLVVTADFAPNNMFEFRRARDVLKEWFEKQETPEFDDKFLSLVVTPVLLNGDMVEVFHDVVYAQGVPIEDNNYRLIMAFDNNQSQEFVSSDIRLDEVKKAVEAELERQAIETQAAMAEAAKAAEEESHKEVNPYEEAVMREYNIENEVHLPDPDEIDDEEDEDEDDDDSGNDDNSDGPSGSSWMRFAND